MRILTCIKCKKTIPDGSLYCCFCGKKQTVTKFRTHKRPHGAGTISKDTRYRKPWIAHAPATKYGKKRIYIGSYATRQEAQQALDEYIKNGRPDLYNATLGDIYKLWSDTHFKQVSQSAISLYSAMWKHFADIQSMPMRDLRTAHIQEIVDKAKSKSTAEILKTLAVMLCKYAVENDISVKNYAEFVKIPKFEKKEKRIFTAEEINILWEHSNDETVQIILLMIYTGLRIGEVTALKVSDVNLSDGYITGGEKTSAGKNRIIPIPPAIPEIHDFIKNMIDGKQKNQSLVGITTGKLRNNFYKAMIDYGISNGHKDGNRYILDDDTLTPHSTRHTFASLSSSAGMRAENLQKIIGHANYNTTAEVYIHQDFCKLKEEMAKLKK